MMLPLPTEVFSFFIHLWVAVAALAFSLLAHELGHYYTLRSYGRSPTVWFSSKDGINVGSPSDYENLRAEKLFNVYSVGVVAGFFALVPSFFLLFPPLSVGLFAVYLVGCRHDFKQIRKWYI